MLKTDLQYAVAFPVLIWILKPESFTVSSWLALIVAWLLVRASQRAADGLREGFLTRFVKSVTDTMLIALGVAIAVALVVAGIWAFSGGFDSVMTRYSDAVASGITSPDGRIVVATELLPWAIILVGTPLRMRRAPS